MSNASSKHTEQHKQWYKLPLRIFVWGIAITVLFVVVLTVMAVAMQQPECPTSYTQQQVDASNCRIGADMSLVGPILVGGFLLLSTLAVSGLVAVLAGADELRKRRS